MIPLKNGRQLTYVVSSGALAFDGQGWLWEKPLVKLGWIKPGLFTVFIKTLTFEPRWGNLRWWKPWSCIRSIPGGAVNKVGLTNPGIEWWCRTVAPRLNFDKYSLAGSIFGNRQELVKMAQMLNRPDLACVETNVSCPNTGHSADPTRTVIDSVRAVCDVSRHPIIVKLSVAQNYLAIADGLKGVAAAVSLNSVPWEIVFPAGQRSPLWKLQNQVGGGGGGVSGKPAQRHNWAAVKELARQGALPVIGPGVMEYEDMARVREIGAQAVSFGAIHLPTSGKPHTLLTNPCKPTQFVEREGSLPKV